MQVPRGVNNFDNPLSAAIYDTAEGVRDDLDVHIAIIEELGAHAVIDVGCGTGVLAIRLADLGHRVTGVDPAGAMLDIARAKPGAEKVLWVHGTCEALSTGREDHSPTETAVPPDTMQGGPLADLVVMAGNVAQVFLTDEEWLGTLRAIHEALAPGGHLVFETRIPERRAWEDWVTGIGPSTYHVDGVGEVHDMFRLLEVDEPFITFSFDNTLPDGSIVPSRTTLIFRSMPELQRTLGAAGFTIIEVRDAPDRPGREWIVIAGKS